MARQEKEIPVYIFMGFLDSGKTTFVKETLIDKEFTDGDKTLLLVCEEGEEEYDEKAMAANNIYVEYIEEDQLTTEHLLDLQDKYKAEKVMIEYNGMWKLDKIFEIRVPKGWTVVQVISFVNAETYDVYQNNMKATMMEQVNSADMVIFNRCDEDSKRSDWRRSIKAVNRRAQIIFEMKDGSVAPDENLEEDLPYDVNADVIELEDDDFGIWYVDASDMPERYVGKKIHFKGMVFKPKQYGKNAFVPGRFAMTCCVEDITFVGFKCCYEGAKNLVDRQWVDVTATIKSEYYPDFGGDGPVLYAEKVVLTGPPEEEVVYFS
jgi:uncharacterized membrane protein YcgQ (UPF0703/DUF1980 family)